MAISFAVSTALVGVFFLERRQKEDSTHWVWAETGKKQGDPKVREPVNGLLRGALPIAGKANDMIYSLEVL